MENTDSPGIREPRKAVTKFDLDRRIFGFHIRNSTKCFSYDTLAQRLRKICGSGLQVIANKDSGMSLVETMITLAVLGAVLVLSSGSIVTAVQTSRLNRAARWMVGEIRHARSLAVSGHATIGVHWGGDPSETSPPGVNYFRLEQNTGTTCSWPALADSVASNPNVITDWSDLSDEYPGISIVSIVGSDSSAIGGMAFNSRGASVNPCTGVAYPISITLTNTAGVRKVVEVRSAGTAGRL